MSAWKKIFFAADRNNNYDKIFREIVYYDTCLRGDDSIYTIGKIQIKHSS